MNCCRQDAYDLYASCKDFSFIVNDQQCATVAASLMNLVESTGLTAVQIAFSMVKYAQHPQLLQLFGERQRSHDSSFESAGLSESALDGYLNSMHVPAALPTTGNDGMHHTPLSTQRPQFADEFDQYLQVADVPRVESALPPEASLPAKDINVSKKGIGKRKECSCDQIDYIAPPFGLQTLANLNQSAIQQIRPGTKFFFYGRGARSTNTKMAWNHLQCVKIRKFKGSGLTRITVVPADNESEKFRTKDSIGCVHLDSLVAIG